MVTQYNWACMGLKVIAFDSTSEGYGFGFRTSIHECIFWRLLGSPNAYQSQHSEINRGTSLKQRSSCRQRHRRTDVSIGGRALVIYNSVQRCLFTSPNFTFYFTFGLMTEHGFWDSLPGESSPSQVFIVQ